MANVAPAEIRVGDMIEDEEGHLFVVETTSRATGAYEFSGVGSALRVPSGRTVARKRKAPPSTKIWDDDFIDRSDVPVKRGRVAGLARKLESPVTSAGTPVSEADAVDALVGLSESLAKLAGVWAGVHMKIWIPPFTRVNAHGNIEHVDGHWRETDITGLSPEERKVIAKEYLKSGVGEYMPREKMFGYNGPRVMKDIEDMKWDNVSRDRKSIEERAATFVDRMKSSPGVDRIVVDAVARARQREEEAQRLLAVRSKKKAKKTLRERVGLSSEEELPGVLEGLGEAGHAFVLAADGQRIKMSSGLGEGTEEEARSAAQRMALVLEDTVGVYSVDAAGVGTLLAVVGAEKEGSQ